MTNKYTITCDLFIIPYKNGSSILYAPLVGFACVANNDLLNLLNDLDNISMDALNPEQRATLEFLDEKGILNGSPEISVVKAFPEKYEPTLVTLFPTNQCNLRCTYCYASAGDFTPMNMDWHYATSAIERVIENLKAKNLRHLSLGFHGGGEPLFPWELIKKIVRYTETRAADAEMQLTVFSATNAVLSKRQLEWILKHFASLNISFDGLPHVQDYHRPLPNGKGSFEFVDRTMRFLDEHHFNYGIRGTISSYNIDLMEETIDFIGQNYNCKAVHLEPLFYCGRCKTSGTLNPDMRTFAENFIKCESRCAEYGIDLLYSGCHIDMLRNSFCGVSSDNFSVTPDGYITACYECTSKDDPKSDTFFIGRIGEDGQLEVDEKKRKYLHSLTVNNLAYCQDCFAKWHCAGDCAAKLEHTDYTGARGNERCQINRHLILNRLKGIIEGTYQSPKTKYYQTEASQKNSSTFENLHLKEE